MRFAWAILSFLFLILFPHGMSLRQTLPIDKLTDLIHPVATDSEALSSHHYLDSVQERFPENVELQIWAEWQKGLVWRKLNPQKACDHFESLSEIPDFPMGALADLRALELCPEDTTRTEALWDYIVNEDVRYLQRLAIEIGLKRPDLIRRPDQKAQLLIEKSKWNMRQGDKLALLNEALAIAKKYELLDLETAVQERMWKLAPRLRPNPPRGEWLSVARDFRNDRQFAKARRYYERVIRHKKTSATERINAYQGLRQTWKLDNNKPKFVAVSKNWVNYTDKLLKRSKKSHFARREFNKAHLEYARALWTEGQIRLAANVLLKAERRLRGRFSLAEIHWIQARMAEERGHFKEALRISNIALKESEKGSETWESILWQRAWNLKRTKKFTEAAKLLTEIIEEKKDSDSKYRFWLAKTLFALGQESSAEKEYRALIETEPLSYYGIMAQRELGENFSPLKYPTPTEILTPESLSSNLQTRLKWLALLGEKDVGREALEIAKVSLKDRTLTTEDQKRLANLYATFEDFPNLFRTFYAWDPGERHDLLKIYPQLVFPRPHYQTVSKAANRWNVPVELVYSIMRQESAFDPNARSFADAFGLMQLTDATARNIASISNTDTYSQPEDLYDPAINIPLGTAQLNHALKKFKNQMIMAVASYNASEQAVVGWVKTRYRGDPLEFIEDIPYRETQWYVKLVLRNYVFYQRLNSRGTAVAFPETFLTGLESFR